MLSPSLPPLRYKTTRLRRAVPWARARSERKAGAAKLKVNAETPPRMNSRRVNAMTLLNQLIFAGPDDQVRDAGGLGRELRVGTGPRGAGARVVDERVVRIRGELRCRHAVERPGDEPLGGL